MKNIFKQKNQLKDLIYIQENKPCNEQTINGLFRSIVEPILDGNVECLVLCRLEEKSKKSFNGILKRLEYSNATVFDFSDTPINEHFENILKENIWEKTEFVYILSQRYGAVLSFDYKVPEIDGFAGIYILHNSNLLSNSFEIINANSKIDLSNYQEKWHPDRRDNETLNNSIRKIVDLLNETNQEVLLSEIEKETILDASEKSCNSEYLDLTQRLDFITSKSNHLAHEIRNQLSICDLYSTIAQKQLAKVKLNNQEVEASVANALDCIQKSIKMTGNSLLDLKSLNNNNLQAINLSAVIKTSVEMAKVYASNKNIKISLELCCDGEAKILADENKLSAVLINLIKNAIESIGEKGEIEIKTEADEDNIKILISNNGVAISKELQEKIFKEGFTTKATGSGLGLYICKKSLEEQFALLKLKKSDAISTEFEITIPRAI